MLPNDSYLSDEDAAFIAARSDVPALCAALREAVEALEASSHRNKGTCPCSSCRALNRIASIFKDAK